MNVLALVTDAFGGSGGIAQYNRDLIEALAGCAGASRIVVMPRLGHSDGALPSGVRQLKAHGSHIGYSLAALGTAVTRGPFDFVFCGHLGLSPLAALLAWFLGVPLWLQLHGQEAWKKADRSQRWAAERAKLVTAVSRYTRARFLSNTGLDPARVRVLPPTVGARFAPGAKPHYLLDRYGVRGKLVLLTVGRLDASERYKGHDKVIGALPEILRTFPDVVYLIVGCGEDRCRLQTLARTIGVDRNVLFLGGVTARELPDMYRLVDLFVMPSMQEGFGIVFLEAAASGVRVIGGNADGSMDALADGAIGRAIDPASRDALVAAVKEGLAGGAVDPSGVRRFNRENFARCVRTLVSERLLSGAATDVA